MDCAVAVMYYMRELFAGRDLGEYSRGSIIRDIRANIAEMFTGFMNEDPAREENTGHPNCAGDKRDNISPMEKDDV